MEPSPEPGRSGTPPGGPGTAARETGRGVGPATTFGAAAAGLAPAAALAAVTTAGTWSATAAGAAAGHLLVLLLALAGAAVWRDPLALGRRGRWLPLALWVTVAASCWASPVDRAGWTVVALAPAWVLTTAAVARLWSLAASRGRQGGAGAAAPAVALVVAAVALVALLGMVRHDDPRASAPLGHHNLLAVWLVTLLPLAVLPWRRGGAGRVLAVAAGGLGLTALALTRSLSGTLALGAMLAVALLARRRIAATSGGGRRWSLARRAAVTLLLAVPLLVALPRLLAIARGMDLSTAARSTYWAAGWRGFTARPALGWGPGSTPWTVHEWLHWIPGVNPPQQMVGDLHSLPFTLLYEVGATGALLAVAVAALFAYRRWRGLPRARDPVLTAAGLVGLVGAAVATLGVSPLAVPAVVVAPALAAAAALAGSLAGAASGGGGRAAGSGAAGSGAAGKAPRWPAWLAIAAAALLLARLDLAHWHYDRSIGAPETEARAELVRAVDLDPGFPLYRAHLARWGVPPGLPPRQGAAAGLVPAAGEALAAAEDALAVPALWLNAGDLALAAGEPWAGIALERACRLDPLAPVPPLLLAAAALADGDRPAAARSAARAFLAEPRLVAATLFDEPPGLRQAAVTEVLAWPGVDVGWRRALAEAVAGLEAVPVGGVRNLRLTTGGSRASSLAFFTFRRRPRPLQLASVPLHEGWAGALALPPATTLTRTSTTAFGERGCLAP